MAKIPRSWRSVLLLIRLHYQVVGNIAMLCLLVMSIMDYGYIYHEWDLLWWCEMLGQKQITPLAVLLHIGGFKVAIILILTLWSYTRGAGKDQEGNEDMPISFVRRRYSRFLVMVLLASMDRLLQHHPRLDDFLQNHKDCFEAVKQFRWRARKLFERTDLQLCLPLHEVLSVDDQQEKELLRLGYGEKLTKLRELDIYKMVYKH
ncbi:uncharacterized protein LOC6543661 [Drosophila erecta]|uniref:Uncharacterized protein n=1 Tax=Drosophila erecta TaxID=7220 RepID=B3NHX1_DROER|nr:uncharacterized protein LOC6543661 [Drosophila erecta]EDV51986.1 uncharacterized protein Dere_GG15825 [Drosophila erecta]